MKKSAPKKTTKSVKKAVKKSVKKVAAVRVSSSPTKTAKTTSGFQVFLWLSIIFSSILIIISRL